MTETHEQFAARWRRVLAAFEGNPDESGLTVPCPGGVCTDEFHTGHLAPGALERLHTGDPGGLDFAGAVLALKAGHHVARDSWPTGRYVMRQAGYPGGIPINQNTAEATGLPQGTVCTFTPYLMMCVNPGGTAEMGDPRTGQIVADRGRPTFTPWQAGGEDVLAGDWRIIPRPATAG